MLETYPDTNVPAAYLGEGGLGRYWHGVIPLSESEGFPSVTREDIGHQLEIFYPGFVADAFPADSLFVPYRPIRPMAHLDTLAAKHPTFVLRAGTVERIKDGGINAEVHLDDGEILKCREVICAAGALGTVRLLMRSDLIGKNERKVSDHVIGYAGRIRRERLEDAGQISLWRSRHGIVFPCHYSVDRRVLYSIRPARFDFAALDTGIEKRAIFGLPTSKVVAGIMGKLSPGLAAEALYNRFGIGGGARWQSVNYFVEGKGLYTLDEKTNLVPPPLDYIRELAQFAVRSVPFEGLERSRRPELYIPSIHLHASLDPEERERFDPFGNCAIKAVDASRLFAIGPAHHSFKMMIQAYQALSPSN